jgi:hypothetical protein
MKASLLFRLLLLKCMLLPVNCERNELKRSKVSTEANCDSIGLKIDYRFDATQIQNGIMNDRSGCGNTGNVYNVAITTDRFGNSNAGYFYGVNSRIDFFSSYGTEYYSQYTISFWVNPANTQSGCVFEYFSLIREQERLAKF